MQIYKMLAPGVGGVEPREPLRGIISSKLAKFGMLDDLLKI